MAAVCEALAGEGVDITPAPAGPLTGTMAGGRGLVVEDQRRGGGYRPAIRLELLRWPHRGQRGGRPRGGLLLSVPAATLVCYLTDGGAAAAPAWWWSHIAASHLMRGQVPAFGGWRWGWKGAPNLGGWCYLMAHASVQLAQEPPAVGQVSTDAPGPADAAAAIVEAVEQLQLLPASTRTYAERHALSFHLFRAALPA